MIESAESLLCLWLDGISYIVNNYYIFHEYMVKYLWYVLWAELFCNGIEEIIWIFVKVDFEKVRIPLLGVVGSNIKDVISIVTLGCLASLVYFQKVFDNSSYGQYLTFNLMLYVLAKL